MSAPVFVPFTAGQASGFAIAAVFAALSITALISVALRTIWVFARSLYKGDDHWRVSKESALVNTQLGRYACSLLIACFFTSISGLIAADWLALGGVRDGRMCTSEAIFSQMGHFGTAYFTVTIGLHTLLTLVFRYHQAKWFGWGVIAVGWVSTAVFGAVPMSFFGPETGFLCGLKASKNGNVTFFFDVLPILLAAIISIAVAALIFLTIRGNVVFKNGFKFKLNIHTRWSSSMAADEYHEFIGGLANSMLWYPIAYILLLLPYAFTRMLDLAGYQQPFASHVFSDACSFLLGMVFVLLLANTFRRLGPVTAMPQDAEKAGSISEKPATDNEKKRVSFGSIVSQALRKSKSSSSKRAVAVKLPARKDGKYVRSQPSRVRNLTSQRSDSISTVSSTVSVVANENRFSGFQTKYEPGPILPMDEMMKLMVPPPPPAVHAPRNTEPKPNHRINLQREPSAKIVLPGLAPPPRQTRAQIQREPSMTDRSARNGPPATPKFNTPMNRSAASVNDSEYSRNSSPSDFQSRPQSADGDFSIVSHSTTPQRLLSNATTASRYSQSSAGTHVRQNSSSSRPLPSRPNAGKQLPQSAQIQAITPLTPSSRPLPTPKSAQAPPVQTGSNFYGEESPSSSSDYGEEPPMSAPSRARSTRVTTAVSKRPMLSPILAEYESAEEALQYPAVPPLHMPAHKRRPNHSARPQPHLKRAPSNIEFMAEIAARTSGAHLASAWKNISRAEEAESPDSPEAPYISTPKPKFQRRQMGA